MKAKDSVKRDRFLTVASRRVQNVLDHMDNLSKCSNKSTYEYDEEDVRKMMGAINNQIKMLNNAFSANKKAGKQTFEF